MRSGCGMRRSIAEAAVCVALRRQVASNQVQEEAAMRVAAFTIMTVLSVAAAAQTAVPPPPVTLPDCGKLKGSAKKDCTARAAQNAATPTPASDTTDRLPFPAEQSKRGTPAGTTADMPTGEPDPPSESMKPMHVPGADADPPAGSSSSSSSSSSDGTLPPPPEDDDAPPTTSGSDTPIKPGKLKDLGARVDSTEARRKLELTRRRR